MKFFLRSNKCSTTTKPFIVSWNIWRKYHRGSSDKGSILKKIKRSVYNDILFVGDSTKDLEYAIEAEVKFFRIKENNDYLRLRSGIKENFPDEKKKWSYTQKEINFFRKKTLFILQPDNRNMNLSWMIDYINNRI